jgi:hypothetical protein
VLLRVALPLQVQPPPLLLRAARQCRQLCAAAVPPLLQRRQRRKLFSETPLRMFIEIGDVFRAPVGQREQVAGGLIAQYGQHFRIFIIIGNYINITPVVAALCPCLHRAQHRKAPSRGIPCCYAGRL